MVEGVRLLIWDLDETFWEGTLTEGGVQIVPRNVEIVKELSRRGIINSICSKNDRDKVKAELELAGVWDFFVFPQIAWVAKGAMVSRIVEWSQLRPETVMFIDDNPINLNEVRHVSPDLQIAGPELLPTLLNDARFKGKDDYNLTRLNQYKVLERKETDRALFEDKNVDFLRQSEIRISFHYDVVDEFERVYELVNRTNQLNFTKNRWSEDEKEARAAFERELHDNPSTHAATVRVADKYGDYGVIGFYMTKPGAVGRKAHHFTFSCRTLNMGIEQFVYRKIGSPKIQIVGEVVSDLKSKDEINWITIVDDATKSISAVTGSNTRVCVRGACELDQMVHYLGHRHDVMREFAFPYRGWGVTVPAAQLFSLWSQIDAPENEEVIRRLPALHRNCLNSSLRRGHADIFVLSFSMEPQWSHYRFKKTGLEVPLKLEARTAGSFSDLTQVSFSELTSLTNVDMSEDDWEWFCENFEYTGGYDHDRLVRNVNELKIYLRGKRSIFVLLNTKHGKQSPLHKFNRELNEILSTETRDLMAEFVSLDDLVLNENEVIDAHHFRRPVYLRLADAVGEAIDRANAKISYAA